MGASSSNRSRLAARVFGAVALASIAACARPARFPAREPMTRDDDERPFSPAPRTYVSPFAWDAADKTIFRPMSEFLAMRPAKRAIDVNAFDEVPDSSWFINRLGRAPLTAEQVARGACDDRVLDPDAPDGTWTIDAGKDNGANPGFRVNIPGLGKFMLKSDPAGEPERATGATSIASRVYHAVGYFAPCDSVVYFRPSLLSLKAGLTTTNNEGVTRPFDQAALDRILAQASHRDGLVRMVASKWLPGRAIGPYKYDGLRDDDPNDVVPHEDRRELRGARLLAAWLNHFDAREQNTMDVFLPANDDKSDPRGFVRHYIIDMGDCFGSVWTSDAISKRLGHAYMLDFPYLVEDYLTLGTIERPWDHAQRSGGVFNYFSERDFAPEMWRAEYPNVAFSKMLEADGAWMARILARFDDDLVAAAVGVGKYDAPSTEYLTRVLRARRDAILKRYFSKLSPVADVRVDGDRLCGVDLARKTGVAVDDPTTFRAIQSHRGDARPARVEATSRGGVCVTLSHAAIPPSTPDGDEARYARVDLWNGAAPGPLRAFVYDLGPERGFRLAGLVRPD